MQLLVVGQTDCVMGYDMQTLSSWEQGVAAVTVATTFQKDPLGLIGHPQGFQRLEDLKPSAILLSDHGWPPYSQTTVCMERTVKERPQAVVAFVKATLQGYKSHLQGDPSAANALIKRDNPAMSD